MGEGRTLLRKLNEVDRFDFFYFLDVSVLIRLLSAHTLV